MSTQSSQFRASSSDSHLRISDAERRAVADRLGEHFADGRLDQAEFDERVNRAMSAKTRADLSGLFDDLPEANSGPDTGAPAGPAAAAGPGRRHRHPVLVLVLLVIIILAATHAVAAALLLSGGVPWLWLGLVAAIVFLATRRSGRSRSRQDR